MNLFHRSPLLSVHSSAPLKGVTFRQMVSGCVDLLASLIELESTCEIIVH